jgi:type IV pilus assembly protein PilW
MNMNSTAKGSRATWSRNGRQQGFGLVELMISIAIGLVILAALVALFVNSSRNNREMATANSVIENGRFAIELLESDIVHAGYWSTYVPDFDDPTRDDAAPVSTPAGAPPVLCEAYDPATWVTGTAVMNRLLGIPVQVFPAADAAAACGVVIPDIANVVEGTDVIVLRHAERCAPGAGSCGADDPDEPELFLQASLCADEIAASPYVFGRTGAAPFEPPFVLTRRDCVTPAEKRRFASYIYYVRDYAVALGDGIPTLVRSEFDRVDGVIGFQDPDPLIEGIDGIWFELGVDNISITGDDVDNSAAVVWDDEDTKSRAVNRGDGVPDVYRRCDPACDQPADTLDLMNVTSVKMYVIARSREATPGYTDTKTYAAGAAGNVGPFDDGFKRHLYSTTIRLPNVSGRRERP